MSAVWTMVVVLVLLSGGILLAMRVFLFRNVSQATSHLDRLSEDYARKEDEIGVRLQEARQQAENIVQEAREEAEKIRAKVDRQTQRDREKTLKDARLQSDQIIQQANKTKDFLLGEIETRINEEGLKKACELIRGALPEDLRKHIHSYQMKEFIMGGLEGLKSSNFPDSIDRVRIVSAFPLSGEDRSILRSELEKRLDMELDIQQEVDEDLIAGLSIVIGETVVEGSLRHGIEERIRHAQRSAVN